MVALIPYVNPFRSGVVMATNELSKEMVDLASKIKKHLRSNYQITIALADPELLDKLVELKSIDDPLLQGMLRYLMALAGPEWTAKLNKTDTDTGAQETPEADQPGGLKKYFALYRGKPVSHAEQPKGDPEAHKAREAEARYRGNPPAEKEEPGSEGEETADKPKKPVRYYRGQPIYD